MASLAVFDFDRTIVDDDSDATIINRLREKQPPPEWESTNHDWTPYMSDVFEHAYSAGLSQDDILSAIGSMRENPGVCELIKNLSASGWDVLLLTDANTVFVHHWLKVHGLEESVTQVVTNRAFWQSGRLFIEPLMRQTACSRCPKNLCKSIALAQFIAQRPPYSRVVYAGDGRNDFCPSTNLPAHAIVFPRRGYPLDDLIRKTLSSTNPLIQAKVVPWDDCYAIIKELFPEKFIAQRPPYSRVVYAGDGRNDFCPSTNLPAHAIVFPRRGYPLDDLIRKTLSSTNPLIQAKVVPWDDCYAIIKELFPEKVESIS